MTVRRADDNRYVLGEALTATGDPVDIKGGIYIWYIEGTAGSATDFRLEIQTPNGTWARFRSINNNVVTVAAADMPLSKSPLYLPPGKVRIAVIGGAATSIASYLVGLG